MVAVIQLPFTSSPRNGAGGTSKDRKHVRPGRQDRYRGLPGASVTRQPMVFLKAEAMIAVITAAN